MRTILPPSSNMLSVVFESNQENKPIKDTTFNNCYDDNSDLYAIFITIIDLNVINDTAFIIIIHLSLFVPYVLLVHNFYIKSQVKLVWMKVIIFWCNTARLNKIILEHWRNKGITLELSIVIIKHCMLMIKLNLSFSENR